jgi:hypothetical protein
MYTPVGGHFICLTCLLALVLYYAQDSDTAFKLAAQYGHTAIALKLLRAGAELNGGNSVSNEACMNH